MTLSVCNTKQRVSAFVAWLIVNVVVSPGESAEAIERERRQLRTQCRFLEGQLDEAKRRAEEAEDAARKATAECAKVL